MTDPITYYSVGTASIANGDTTITFAGAILGTASAPNIQSGDMFRDPAQPAIPSQPIVSVDYDAGTAEVWAGWPGASMSADAYRVDYIGDVVRSTAQTRRLLEQLSVVQATASNLFYLFDDTTTDSDPGPGKLRIDNASIASSTGGYLDDLDAKGAPVGTVIQSWDDLGTVAARGQLWVRSVTTPTTFHALLITGAVTDGTGYRKLEWTYIGGSGGFAADDEMMVFFVPQGADGTNAILGIWQGAWQTATAYDVDDLVEEDGSTYICVTAHTSGTFATDLAASKWDLAVEKGDQGIPGNAATIAVGTVTTVATGDPATVTNSGDTHDAVFDFELPTGATGRGFAPQGAYSGATAYVADDLVLDNGSTWRAKISTTGNAPPVLPTTSNTQWELFAAKGTDGTGTGDVVGPAGATSGNLASYASGTGKLIGDSGIPVAKVATVGKAIAMSIVFGG